MDINSLPENWSWKSLGQNAEVCGGYGFPKVHQGRTDLPYPFIKVSDMNTANGSIYVSTAANTIDEEVAAILRARIFPAGTVIFPKVGGAIATNKKRIINGRATFDNNVMGVITNDALDRMWLFYYLCSVDLMELARIGPVPSIRQSAVQALQIPLPYPDDPARSLAEQRRIVARIEALFAELRECRRLHEAVVTDTGRLMDAVVNDCFQDGIASGWKRTAIEDLIVGKPQYGTSKKANSDGVGIPVLRMGNIQ